jgi:pimeloyl-ACP methyl ester carboxylesterase
MYETALAAYDYAVALPGVDPERVAAMGYSIGSGCAVYLAANRPVSALILAAPYANGYDLYNNYLPIFKGPLRALVKHKLPSEDWAQRVSCPTLILASRTDELVPYTSSVALSGRFPGDAELVTLEDTAHNEIFTADVWAQIRAFLADIQPINY